MLQVIQNAKEQHDIERPHVLRSQAANIRDVIVNSRPQPSLGFEQARILRGIDRENAGPAPLHFKAEPAIPRTDIQHTLAGEIFRNMKLADTRSQLLNALVA